MVTKKVESKTTRKSTKKSTTTKQTTSREKITPVTVVKRSTAPKVVVETKTIDTQYSNNKVEKKSKKLWKLILKIVFWLLTIANFILLCVCLNAIKEQQRFTILSNGGEENYKMLKEIFETERRELESTQSINTYYAN